MRFDMSRSAIMGIVVALVAASLVWGGYALNRAQLGDWQNTVALVNSVVSVSSNSYDSFESPRGTDYQVPSGKTLYINTLLGHHTTHGSAHASIQIGYGSTAVGNSATAPIDAVIVFSYTEHDHNAQVLPIETWVPIPAGMYPFMLVDTSSAYQATGVLR